MRRKRARISVLLSEETPKRDIFSRGRSETGKSIMRFMMCSYELGWRVSRARVEEVGLASGEEGFVFLFPEGGELSWWGFLLESFQEVRVAEESIGLAEFEFRAELVEEGVGEVEAEFDRANGVAVGDDEADAAAFLFGEFARGWGEADGEEAEAREFGLIEFCGELEFIEPCGAEDFEGGVGAAADADVAELEHADARVEKGGGGGAHVG